MERTAKMEEMRGHEEYKSLAQELWRNGRKTTIISYLDAQVVTLTIRRRIFGERLAKALQSLYNIMRMPKIQTSLILISSEVHNKNFLNTGMQFLEWRTNFVLTRNGACE